MSHILQTIKTAASTIWHGKYASVSWWLNGHNQQYWNLNYIVGAQQLEAESGLLELEFYSESWRESDKAKLEQLQD